jgi:transketolase
MANEPSMTNLEFTSPPLDDRSLYLRRQAIRALDGGGRGHLGSTLSLIEILRVLYDDILIFRPSEPNWDGRDRCVFSKGHGCIALYVILADKGFFDDGLLETFCHPTSILGGHPERDKVPGVEASTGALGHGLSISVGMALAARMKGRDNRVFTVMGDGEINEGSVWEAAMNAGKHKLSNLTAIVDYNKLQSYGPTADIQDIEPLADKWKSFGFSVREVDGHHVDELRKAFNALPYDAEKPSAIICHTIKGKGIPFAEGEPTWHHKSRLPADQIAEIYKALGA